MDDGEDHPHGGRSFVLRQLSSVAPGLLAQPSGSLPDELIRRLSVYDPVSDQRPLQGHGDHP